LNLAQALYRLGQFQAAHEAVEDHIDRGSDSDEAERLRLCARRWEPDFGPILGSSATEPPRKILSIPPVYPDAARTARVEGTVVVETVIRKDGRVSCARIVRSLPLLDLAAVGAVEEWKFEPATLHGSPVDVIFTLTVNFRL